MDGSFPILISKNDDLNSASNPILVQTVNGAPAEVITKIANYKTSTVNGNASDNQDYTVIGTTFRLRKLVFACSGKAKFEIKVGPVATLISKAVVLLNPSQTFGEITFDTPIEVGTGNIVRVVRTNNQSAANDIYSTLVGEDVA